MGFAVDPSLPVVATFYPSNPFNPFLTTFPSEIRFSLLTERHLDGLVKAFGEEVPGDHKHHLHER